MDGTDVNIGGDGTTNTIGDDIVKSFHEQFAQNQNHHQNLFIQTLVILLTVLIGYGYVYVRVGSIESDLNVTIETLYAYQVIALFLLSTAIALISNMALGFRRDQLMAANIRIRTKVMTLNSNDNYFFGTFNPQGKTKFILWMPEFHIIFFISLIIMKSLLVVITYQYNIDVLGESFYDCRIFIYISTVSFIVDIIVTIYYWTKWVSCSKAAPEILIKK